MVVDLRGPGSVNPQDHAGRMSTSRQRSSDQHRFYLDSIAAQQAKEMQQSQQSRQLSFPQQQLPQQGGGGGGATGNGLYDYARQQLQARGMGDEQNWNSLYSLWQKESNWNPSAVNASSGAFGIAQILPSAHPTANRNMSPQEQIDWGINYIAGRYGSPQAAWAHSQKRNWY